MESKFLDDQLYNHLKNKPLNKSDDFKELLNELYKVCENYWKPKVDAKSTSNKEVKVLLDRTFNAWDLFIKKLVKEKWFLADVIVKYSYKEIFMQNDQLKKAYENL